jgi:hypothetical protein
MFEWHKVLSIEGRLRCSSLSAGFAAAAVAVYLLVLLLLPLQPICWFCCCCRCSLSAVAAAIYLVLQRICSFAAAI